MMGCKISRKAFLSGGLCGLAGLVRLPLLAADGPRLRFGVISDVHIGGRKCAEKRLVQALNWLKLQDVDAVLSPGDIMHTGRISQFETFMKVWNGVFPAGRRADGVCVPLMISTGNHDADDAFWGGASAEKMRRERFSFGDNPQRLWRRYLGQDWQPVWRTDVNGYTFVGCQWPSFKPDLSGYMSARESEFRSAQPFFYCQHEMPLGTCHGTYGEGCDNGESVRVLSAFPNAVAFSGHSHCSLADEATVWQRSFTSIGAGCLHEAALQFGYDNCSAFWHPSDAKNFMCPLNDPEERWGGDPDGGCFAFVEVFDSHLIVHRRSSVFDAPIGPDWIVPLPARPGGPFDPAQRTLSRSAPCFAEGACATVGVHLQGHPLASKRRSQEACVSLRIPAALPVDGCRVFTYEISVRNEGRCVKSGKVFAADFALPDSQPSHETLWLVPLADFPAGVEVTFEIVPRDCFGHAGRPLVTPPFRVPTDLQYKKEGELT